MGLMTGIDKADMERANEAEAERPERPADVAARNHFELVALTAKARATASTPDDPVQRGHAPGSIPKGAFADMGPELKK